MKSTNPVFTGLPTTVFEVMTRLANANGAINLGQGFPDEDGPRDVRALAADALVAESNQYPPMMGLPELRQAVAAAQNRFFGLNIDWQSEVLVTSGATEALSDAIMALVEPGDEVVVFEPLYDCYIPLIERAGATARTVRLTPPDWQVTRDALAEVFGPKTKAILINNPMNPAAKLFSSEELAIVAELVVSHDAYAICDEVYEHIVFDGQPYTPLMACQGMRERAVHIGSAGKTLSLTGWKVGYIAAAPALLEPITKAHQFTTFTTPPNLQRAVAFGLSKDDDYYAGLAGDLQAKRDRFGAALKGIGFDPAPCAATYFIVAGYQNFAPDMDDVTFCRAMTEEAKVTALPLSAFYRSEPPAGTVRFCFSKRDQVLSEAIERMGAWIAERFRS